VIQGAPAATTKRADAAPAEALGDEEEEEDEEEDTDDAQGDAEDEAGAAARLPFPKEQLDQWELRHARRRGGESGYRHQRPNQFYPIYVDPKTGQVVRTGPSINLGRKPDFSPVRGLRPVWPIDREGNDRCWRLVSERMQALIDAGRVVTGRYNPEQEMWTINIWVPKAASKKLKTVWWDSAHDAGTHGTTLLHKLLGVRGAFPFPKSLYAVKDCLAAVVRNRPQALILDFFAGSGTTFHATCLLNAEDSGSRRSVLVTNNEVAEKTARRLRKQALYPGDSAFEKYGIFSQATRPRCEAVVTGKRRTGRRSQARTSAAGCSRRGSRKTSSSSGSTTLTRTTSISAPSSTQSSPRSGWQRRGSATGGRRRGTATCWSRRPGSTPCSSGKRSSASSAS
jgi:adenine-specific DNA-methyltransferase